MKSEFCVWCDKPVKVQDNFNHKTDRAVCSKGCKGAETIFRVWMSDEAIHQRAHYRALTGGADEKDKDQ